MRESTGEWFVSSRGSGGMLNQLRHQICTSTGASNGQIMDRVIGLVKKYDKVDVSKVTETADFQKDLSLDSLDRVELVMAIEEEFSIEIPDEKADKLTCCADVAKYIASGSGSSITKS
ncbi:Acyl carrier protein (ACP) [Corchorus olitorius]|uniref:Acyl carrier protein n=1 Tax=Corchorus olitorius TaxID=93759 RepID=A0A1R3H326_9ROSI|nr:Acyl carrier protein (ACP) [Corchorus olitorius]